MLSLTVKNLRHPLNPSLSHVLIAANSPIVRNVCFFSSFECILFNCFFLGEIWRSFRIQNEVFSLPAISVIRLEFFNFLSHFPRYHFHSQASLVSGILYPLKFSTPLEMYRCNICEYEQTNFSCAEILHGTAGYPLGLEGTGKHLS